MVVVLALAARRRRGRWAGDAGDRHARRRVLRPDLRLPLPPPDAGPPRRGGLGVAGGRRRRQRAGDPQRRHQGPDVRRGDGRSRVDAHVRTRTRVDPRQGRWMMAKRQKSPAPEPAPEVAAPRAGTEKAKGRFLRPFLMIAGGLAAPCLALAAFFLTNG